MRNREAATLQTGRASRLSAERGTTLVHVAIGLVTLMGMLAYSVDRGIVWVSRGQAQNAADAGAMAGALARGFDEFTPPASGGIAETAALAVAGLNSVWGVPGSTEVSWTCPTGVTGRCARVNVYRNQAHSNALPVIFGHVLGITEQGVRATATAVVDYGNTVRCMRPFAIPDTWTENPLLPLDAGEYNHWASAGVEVLNPDSYGTPGAAWDADQSDGSSDLGRFVGFDPATPYAIRSDQFFTVIQGGASPATDITGCAGAPVAMGQTLPVDPAGMGPISAEIASLINSDPAAMFNTGTRRLDNSCVPGCGPISPRVVPIIVFDVEDFQYKQVNGWMGCPSNSPCLGVVNILGLFVTGSRGGSGVEGYLTLLPGKSVAGVPNPPSGSNFLIRAQLVR